MNIAWPIKGLPLLLVCYGFLLNESLWPAPPAPLVSSYRPAASGSREALQPSPAQGSDESEPAQRPGFGWINFTTLSLYLMAMVGIGVYWSFQNRSTDDFFRGGQQVPWWAAGLSIFATMLSSITFMAIPAQSYANGWGFFLQNAFFLITPLIVWVYLPFYRQLNVTSAYEYLEMRFNRATRLFASLLFIFFQSGRIAVVLFLPALALSTVSRFDIHVCIVLMGLLCILYTVLGGIRAVIWTDVCQSVVLLGSAVFALLLIVASLDGGWSELFETARSSGRFFQGIRWEWSWDVAVTTGWVILFGGIAANLFPYTASQDVVQRYVTTKDERSAARAIWGNAVMSPLASGLFFLIGTALWVFYSVHPERLDPGVSNDGILAFFVFREMPAGVAGFVVAGVFGAAQSTLSSSLNSIAACYVVDFHRLFRPGTTDRRALRIAQLVIVLVGLIGTTIALLLTMFDIESIWETFINILGLFGGAIAGLFVLGIFTLRTSAAGAMMGALSGFGAALSIYLVRPASGFVYAPVSLISCILVGYLASLMIPWIRTGRVGVAEGGQDLSGLTIHTRKR